MSYEILLRRYKQLKENYDVFVNCNDVNKAYLKLRKQYKKLKEEYIEVKDNWNFQLQEIRYLQQENKDKTHQIEVLEEIVNYERNIRNGKLQQDLDKANDIIEKDRQFYKCRMDELVNLKQENKQLKEELKNKKIIFKEKQGKELDLFEQFITNYSKSHLAEMLCESLDNWNKLKKWIGNKDNNGFEKLYVEDIQIKMQELENGDKNV